MQEAAPESLFDLGHSLEIEKLVEIGLKCHGFQQPNVNPKREYFWEAGHFGLDQVKVFNGASKEERDQVLKDLSRSLLDEAYYIEKAGMSFAGKMNQLCSSVEEKCFYNLMGAEESNHYYSILPFMKGQASPLRDQRFAQFIGEVICDGGYRALHILIQVVLEGWGISHYASLKNNCNDNELKRVLGEIIRDEARHHGGGVVLAKKYSLPLQSFTFVRESLCELLEMVRIGPASVLQSLDTRMGIKKSERGKILEELDAELATQTKLDKLKSLMFPSIPVKIFSDLENRQMFHAYSIKKMANLF